MSNIEQLNEWSNLTVDEKSAFKAEYNRYSKKMTKTSNFTLSSDGGENRAFDDEYDYNEESLNYKLKIGESIYNKSSLLNDSNEK